MLGNFLAGLDLMFCSQLLVSSTPRGGEADWTTCLLLFNKLVWVSSRGGGGSGQKGSPNAQVIFKPLFVSILLVKACPMAYLRVEFGDIQTYMTRADMSTVRGIMCSHFSNLLDMVY